ADFSAAAAAAQGQGAQGAVATKERPNPLRAKGIDDNGQPPLVYTGPSEDGSAEVKRTGGGGGTTKPGGGTTRRERREAARAQKSGKHARRR
ncbi:hypothetical protein, partial [Mycolicibacterium obuense]